MTLSEEEKTKTATKQTVIVTVPLKVIEQLANVKKVEFQTNQEFVEESILIANGNRMRIPDIESL